jgi:hypothetical protein
MHHNGKSLIIYLFLVLLFLNQPSTIMVEAIMIGTRMGITFPGVEQSIFKNRKLAQQ